MPLPHVDVHFSDKVLEDDQASIEAWIAKMESAGLPPILNGEHLSMLSGVALSFIYGVSNSQPSFYRSFRLRKKGGGARRIDAPLPSLLRLQRWILDEIIGKVPLHPAAKAYRAGYSIKDAARLHRGRKLLLLLDVRNFFPSISEHHVYRTFTSIGYPAGVSVLLAKVCTLNGSLPQGAPTSGALSNVLLTTFDDRMLSECKERGLRYSRYADDIQISGEDFDSAEIAEFARSQLASIDLSLKTSKTQLLRRSHRQMVTGVVVNERLSVRRSELRRLRQACYYIGKFGLFGHCRHIGSDNPRLTIERLIGQISHAIFVNPKDRALARMKDGLIEVRKQTFGR